MSAETTLHCAWCDGEGRCGGIAVGCTGPKSGSLMDSNPGPEEANALAFRLATIEAYPFTSAKETMQRGAVMIRALATRQTLADERIHRLEALLLEAIPVLDAFHINPRGDLELKTGWMETKWLVKAKSVAMKAAVALQESSRPTPTATK
jgi:hypothetical protein